MTSAKGFTLIEVLLALMIIAIGLTALLKAMALNIQYSARLKEHAIQHIVGMNAVAQLQMTRPSDSDHAAITQSTEIMGQKWYWQALISQSAIGTMQQITVRVSPHQAGPFSHPLIAYRYAK